MKPLKRLKHMELMCCNYDLLLRLLWRYMQALVSATSAGSHRPLHSGSVGVSLPGFRWASEHVLSIWLNPPLAVPLFLYCDLHTAKVTGLACMRESAQYSQNINQT